MSRSKTPQEPYLPIGLTNWEMPDSNLPPNFVQVYIRLADLIAFCAPDEDMRKIQTQIAQRVCKEKANIEKPILEGFFVKAGTVSFHTDKKMADRRSIEFYIKVPKINKNGLADCEEKLAKSIAQRLIWQNDKDAL